METPAFIKSLGDFLDALGGYYAVRFLIRDVADVRRTIKVLAALAVVMGICMTNEQITHQNIFGYLGGLPITPQIREGKLRSQGAFAVYIDAGEFGAVLEVTVVAQQLWSDKKSQGCRSYLGHDPGQRRR